MKSEAEQKLWVVEYERKMQEAEAMRRSRTRGLSDDENIATLAEELDTPLKRVPRISKEHMRQCGIPARYAQLNIGRLVGPANSKYGEVVKQLLTLFPCVTEGNLQWTKDRPHRQDGIIALIGHRGVGKTHLACSLANVFDCRFRDALYRRAQDIFREVKSTYSAGWDSPKEADLIEQFTNGSLLVLDEITAGADSRFENDLIVNLIDRRYAEQKPTVLISNSTEEELWKTLGTSVRSRMEECGTVIECDWPSFRSAAAENRSA